MLISRSDLATGLKIYKQSILGATVSMFRWQCLVVSGVKEGKASFEVRNSSLVGCGTVSYGKSGLSVGEYCLNLQCRTIKE